MAVTTKKAMKIPTGVKECRLEDLDSKNRARGEGLEADQDGEEHQYQCQTSRIIPEVHQQMQMAGAAMVDFLRSLKKNYQTYWGAVGVPKHIQSFYSDLALCWDIPKLLKFPATAPQKEALCRLADASLCC